MGCSNNSRLISPEEKAANDVSLLLSVSNFDLFAMQRYWERYNQRLKEEQEKREKEKADKAAAEAYKYRQRRPGVPGRVMQPHFTSKKIDKTLVILEEKSDTLKEKLKQFEEELAQFVRQGMPAEGSREEN